MAKNKVSEWSSVPSNNVDVGGIDIAEGCAPSGINNAMREMMAQIKDMQAGTDGDNFTVGGNLTVTGTTTLTTDLAITDGGTGASTAADARTNLGLGTIATQAASSVSITGGSITGITDLAVADGGTGASTLTANAVLIGNGTSAVNFVAPGTSGNVLTSNGTNWTSAAAATGITTTTGSAPYYGARAFVNFNGTGTVAIRASGNIASVVRASTGIYTVTFTTAMPDANYTILVTAPSYSTGSSEGHGGVYGSLSGGASSKSTTSFQVFAGDSSVAGFIDCAEMNVVVFR